MTLIQSLKKIGFRENLNHTGLRVLNLEISIEEELKKKLEDLGVDVQNDMNIGISSHSYHTTKITTMLKNAEISLAENGINGFKKWHEVKPHIVGLSISAFNVGDSAQKLMSEKSFLLCSSGNSGVGTGYEQTDKWFSSIGACDENFIMRDYSSYGVTDIDFTGMDGFDVDGKQLLGTSYSRPFVTVICGQLYIIFKNLYGFFPTPMQIFNFMKKHTIDVAEIGFDEKSGYGVPYIPSDENIKFFEYIDIPQEIIDCVSVNLDKTKIAVQEKGVDLSAKSNYNANLLAYIVRRKMFDLRLSIDDIMFNFKSIDNELFYDLVKNSSIMIDKIESGKA